MKNILWVIMAAVMLTACASSSKNQEIIGSVEKLYNEGMDQLEKRRWSKAINTFEELERQHPYSGWATRAQMMVSYAHFRAGDLDQTVSTAERFIRMHPGHKDLPYMYYLIGLSHYVRISDVQRDQGFTERAMRAFQEVVNRYPESEYAQDSQLKMTLCMDHLAGKEMTIGRYYQHKENYLAGINRFKAVVDHYERSSQTPEALYRLTESYLSLGLKEEAQRTAAVLGHNFPSSAWYKKAYALMQAKGVKIPDEKPKNGWLS